MPRDPRAYSKEQLVAPEPLPYVSRRALYQVKDPLPPPTHCRYCEGEVVLVHNDTVYGSCLGDWPFIYYCPGCKARVGLHPNTDIPLGTLATKRLRKMRKVAKTLFHRVMEQSGQGRTTMYQWLAARLDIPAEECHFGWFDEDDCARVIDICERHVTQTGIEA